jgi:exodeoxyribonuclease VII large subunit
MRFNDDGTPQTLSVADFLSGINASLTAYRGRIEGEVTSVKSSYQAAIYFSIKDLESNALLNCVIWRNVYVQNGVEITEGDKIIITGTPEIYAPRGSFTVKVQTIEYAGEGALKKSYDELREKLSGEGLLDAGTKRVLPIYPKKIGVITSRSGVVIQDFNANLGRYGFQTTMVDSRVEGKDAIHEILAALQTMAKQDIDVLVIMRGGGSWESLQAFNTESVVRAIASSKCPVLTGIGHDVDVTLAELVADVGASTPTAVAEVLNASWDTLTGSLQTAESHIMHTYQRHLSEVSGSIERHTATVCRRYDRLLTASKNALNDASSVVHAQYRGIEKTITQANTSGERIIGIMRAEVRAVQSAIDTVQTSVLRQLRVGIGSTQQHVIASGSYVVAEQGRAVTSTTTSLSGIEQNIRLSDPARNLKLGYSLSYVEGKLVRSIADVPVGGVTTTRLADGSFTSDITKIT